MNNKSHISPVSRIKILYIFVGFICIVLFMRLFYLQVIRHGYYQEQALGSQLKRYEIPAERGAIFALDGGEQVPIVLNERRYNIVADPLIIIDKQEVASLVADVLKLSKDEVLNSLESDSRYEILARKQTDDIKDQIEKLTANGEIVGIFAEKTIQRVYPHGSLASQSLGFVNDSGEGNYGVEEYLNDDLSGQTGRVRALTDMNGVPLLAGGDNILEDPVDGDDVTLSIDIAMQRQLEIILKQGLDNARSKSGSAIIMDPNTGAIKAIANYPSYDPAKFNEVEDAQIFNNAAVSSPLEPGSIMKALTTAAALDSGSVAAGQSYYDPGFYNIDDATVRNIEEDGGAAQRTVSDILRYSLNTGATWLLMQMGGGELNEQGRKTWNDYMTNRFYLGQKTGIEQGFEETGFVPDPVDGFGLNIRYANTAFGQGMTATPIQMISALASVVNGGTYFQPTLIAGKSDNRGIYKPKSPIIVKEGVVSKEVSKTLVDFMQTVVENNSVTRTVVRDGYIVGGKTGTAEVARPEGGYYEDRFNGTYYGFVGGDKPEYVIITRVNEPGIPGYAGSQAAGPIFVSIVNTLIDNFSVKAVTN